MWFDYAVAVACTVVFAYLPGFVFFKAFRADSVFAFSCAPFYSILGYCTISCLLPYVGASASWLTVSMPVLLVALIAFVASWLIRRGALSCSKKDDGGSRSAFSLIMLGSYVIVGIIVTGAVFVVSLNGADSFVPTFDNVHHYNLVQSFLDSGNWSSLSTSSYPVNDDPSASPMPGSSYYPAAWHLMCALLGSALSVSVSLAANAVNFAMAAMMFPSGMCLLMLRVFPESKAVVAAGALATSSFCFFPSVLLEVWPLYPNALSLALTLPLAACFIALCGNHPATNARAMYALAFVAGVIGSVFVQPNAVFTAAAFLIPYCAWRSFTFARQSFSRFSHCRIKAAGMSILVVVLCIAIWAVCYCLPFLQSTVQYYWAPVLSFSDAVANSLSLSFVDSLPQPVLAAMVILGVIATLVRRRYLWLTFSFVLACLIFISASSMGDVFLKHFLSGFWYTDPYRIGAFAVAFAVPLASLGMAAVLQGVSYACKRLPEVISGKVVSAAMVVLVGLFSVTNFSPTVIPGDAGSEQSAFGRAYESAARMNDAEGSWVYDEDEIAFVRRALEIVPEGDVVLNQPFDGSLLAYGISHLDTYYRTIERYGSDSETQDSVVIRTSLNRVAEDVSVKEAVKRVGAKYLLVMERSDEALSSVYPGRYYVPEDWTGINSVDDDTPGFEVVLAEDDMRLYRISVFD